MPGERVGEKAADVGPIVPERLKIIEMITISVTSGGPRNLA